MENHLVSSNSNNLVISSADELVLSIAQLNERLSLLEKYHGMLHLPSYVGLRKAFSHLAAAVSYAQANDGSAASKEAEKLNRELSVARINAVRATVDYCHYRLLIVERRYPSEMLYKFCADYFNIRDDMDRASELVSKEPMALIALEDDLHWLEQSYLPSLIDVYDQISKAEQAALIPEQANNDREEHFKRIAIAGLIVGVFGLGAAVVSFFV